MAKSKTGLKHSFGKKKSQWSFVEFMYNTVIVELFIASRQKAIIIDTHRAIKNKLV